MRAGTSNALQDRVADAAASRRLVVTWQHPIERTISPVGMLSFDGHSYRFHYLRHALHVKGFRPFLGFPDLHGRYTSDRLFPLFAQRAMTPRRPDFARWVKRLGLEEDASPFEQITRSGGHRPGDTIQLFPVPTVANGHLECDFLVHGIRHIAERPTSVAGEVITLTRDDVEHQLAALCPGDELRLHDEPTNTVNPLAILTTTAANVPLGWVPDLLLEELDRIPDRQRARVTALVVNGPEAGWHLRLLAHLSVPVPDGFAVFVDDPWQPNTR
ncbi:hypothetical protein O982_24030 [Mycobacterium avium 10-5581]|nr:hypothetical protein O982_24030 [Mycobacterium avium 10-5581]